MSGAPTYLDLIERGAAEHAGRTAVSVGDRDMTFAEVNGLADRLASAFRHIGAAPGARVALLVNNGAHSIPIDFACVKAGINRVPLNSRLSRDEHVRMVRESGCRFLVFGSDLAPRAGELREAVAELACYGLEARLPGGEDLFELAALEPDAPLRANARPDEVALTLYTSGTTGVLKAAQHTQASFAAICRNILLNLFPVAPDDAMLHAASLIHASGTFVLPLWLRGGRNVVLPGFEPGSFLAAIEKHRPTAINVVPTMLQMLLDHPDIERRDLSSLRRIIYGASPMPRVVIERAMARFGRDKFWQYYGQTEFPLCISVLRPEDHEGETLAACGRPAVDVEVRLANERGEPVPLGEPGEILVRGPSAAVGYFNAPELTAQTFGADGWVRTRDVGVFDARGFLYLRDRTSDMIITGGYNVYPREVEDALLTHPAVSEAAVVGAPDEKWVEAVVAFVVLRQGAEAGEAELIEHVGAQIASYKKPRHILFTDAIPKTAVGKLDRKVLRACLKEGETGPL